MCNAYIYIYAIYEYMARLTSRTINQLADFQRGETARLHLEGRILGRAEKQKEKKKKKKKEGKVRISIYRGVGGLLNFIWSEWSRFSLSRCYGLSMQVSIGYFYGFRVRLFANGFLLIQIKVFHAPKLHCKKRLRLLSSGHPLRENKRFQDP